MTSVAEEQLKQSRPPVITSTCKLISKKYIFLTFVHFGCTLQNKLFLIYCFEKRTVPNSSFYIFELFENCVLQQRFRRNKLLWINFIEIAKNKQISCKLILKTNCNVKNILLTMFLINNVYINFTQTKALLNS